MRIIIAIDGSPASQTIVDHVAGRPWPPQSEVRLITVEAPLPPPMWETGHDERGAFDRILQQQRDAVASRLQAAAKALAKAHPDLRVTPMFMEGRPKQVIIEEAERWHADLIIVGSHGYGAMKRLILGSVSLGVALGAPCSVEIVRAKEGAAA